MRKGATTRSLLRNFEPVGCAPWRVCYGVGRGGRNARADDGPREDGHSGAGGEERARERTLSAQLRRPADTARTARGDPRDDADVMDVAWAHDMRRQSEEHGVSTGVYSSAVRRL